MIDYKEAIKIQEILIDSFGGTKGIRDVSLLKSALSRPFQTFDKKELHKSIPEKAAAIIESIVINHPFLDGNKRVGYVLMRLYLMENNHDIQASFEEKLEFVTNIAKGIYKFNEIIQWIESKLV
jgi:death-on-curing protein